MNTQSERGRLGLVLLLVFSGLLIGLVVGGLVSARFLVDKSDGLAGGAIVLFHALITAIVLGVAGGIAGKVLSRPKAVVLAWIAGPIALVIFVLLAWRATMQMNSHRAALEEGYASLLPYEIELSDSQKIEHFSYVYADNAASVKADNRVCTGSLPGPSRLALLGALRGVEGRPISCRDCDAKSARVTWEIREVNGDINSGEFGVSDSLLSSDGGVKALLEAIEEASRKVRCE